jgi:other hect domain ubiquitin protein ligase E3
MKFERLEIANNIDKKKNEVIKIMTNNINYTDDINEQNIENINIKNLLKNNLTEKESLFLQAFNQYKYYDISNYRAKKFPGDPKLAFQVIFKNEFVQGLGGPYRQFFSDISKELNEYLPLIIETQNNINQKGEFKDLYTINPSYNGINALEQYEFLGVLMGICIRTGVHLTLDLCSLVWKQIVNEKINLEDIFQFDEGLYNKIKMIYNYDPNKVNKEKKENNKEDEINEDNNPINKEKEEIEDVFNYNCILSDGSLKNFKQNKEKKELILSKSTPAERLKYISMLIYYRLNEAEIQINSIKQGLSKIIPLSILQLFTGKELSLLVCGKKDVDIELLKQNTKLSNDLKEDSKEVRWLWEILNEITPEEKIKFIKFCWAQERLPTSHEEYVKNQIAFTIKYNKNDINKNGFPKADTCFFNLELPNYTAKNIMKKNLLIAIGLDNNSMNADKITGVNSMNISNNQRGSSNKDDYEKEDDYDDKYDDNYQSGDDY